MSYQLNKTDGSLLTELVDGQVDKDSTNLVLVGKNYTGYGEFINENFIKLLENFANTAAPSNPVTGQIWWDTRENRLKIFNGANWKSSGGSYVQGSVPDMVAGDFWIDNRNNQLYAFDGSDLILIGPQYTAGQGKTGFEVATIIDYQGASKTILKLFINNEVVAVISNVEFTPRPDLRIPSLITEQNPDAIIYKGINVVDKQTFTILGYAESAYSLSTENGGIRTPDQFLPSDSDGYTTGKLFIQNSGGLSIGLVSNNVQKIVNDRFYIENQINDQDLSIRVRSSAYGSLIKDAIYVKSNTASIGIFESNPLYTLDINGDIRVKGNMIVEGDTVNVDVSTLSVEDKNIELANSSSGPVGDNLMVDDGGIILRSTSGDKSFTWKNSTNSWTSTVNIDLSNTATSIKIGGVDKLTNTSLSNILYANDLITIGTLQYLNVDAINIDNNAIVSSVQLSLQGLSGINLIPQGDIEIVGNHKITGLSDPINDQDATNKRYVETRVLQEPIVFSMDITGLGVGAELIDTVVGYLNDLYPASDTVSGKIARIHTTSYTNVEFSGIDIDSAKDVSYIAVDSNGTLNESVVQDISFSLAGGVINMLLNRALMVFQSDGIGWNYVSTTNY